MDWRNGLAIPIHSDPGGKGRDYLPGLGHYYGTNRYPSTRDIGAEHNPAKATAEPAPGPPELSSIEPRVSTGPARRVGRGSVVDTTEGETRPYNEEMRASEASEAARRLRIALDLHAAGVSLMRARLRREHPEADDTELRQRLNAWLQTRPGARWGDAVGRRRDL